MAADSLYRRGTSARPKRHSKSSNYSVALCSVALERYTAFSLVTFQRHFHSFVCVHSATPKVLCYSELGCDHSLADRSIRIYVPILRIMIIHSTFFPILLCCALLFSLFVVSSEPRKNIHNPLPTFDGVAVAH